MLADGGTYRSRDVNFKILKVPRSAHSAAI